MQTDRAMFIMLITWIRIIPTSDLFINICIFNKSSFSAVSAAHDVSLQITTGPYRTKHGQAIRAEFIEEFTHIEHVQAGKTNSSMNFVWIA